jgi:RNA polymerase sigma factor (sigma-70 family)
LGISEHMLVETWIRSRDGEAFKSIVDTYGGMVYASAKRILGSAADAEDLTQECFAALAGLKHPPKAPLGPWLHRVVVNLSLNRIKADRSREVREGRFAAATPHVVEPTWPELERILDETIADLPERLRAPIVAHYLLGKSHNAIAQEMGLSRQAVTYRVEKAIEKLRFSLQRKGVTLAGTTLIAFLGSQTADALPPPLALSLGKTALASACGATQASTAIVPLAVKGVLAVTTATKVGIGVGAAVAVAGLVWFSGMVTTVKIPPEQRTVDAGAAAPPAQEYAQTPSTSSAPSKAEETAPAAEAASSVQDPPIAGLWQVVSCTWNGTPSGQPEEVFDPSRMPPGSTNPNEPPLARLETHGDSFTITFLEPWKLLAPYETMTGTRDRQTAVLRAGEERLPLVIRGSFSSNWMQFTAEGGYNLEEASPVYLLKRAKDPEAYADSEASRLALALKKLGAVESAARLAAEDTLEKRRKEVESFAKAIAAYANSHNGALPADLAALAKEEYLDESLLKEAPHRKLLYANEAIPSELLDEGTPWDRFNLAEPIGERIAAWEVYQQKRWGKDYPLLSPALTVEYDEPYLQFSIDAFGETVERDYRVDAPGAEDTLEARDKSQHNLKGLALLLHVFMSTHDGILPRGWCSVYPDNTNVASFLTHPLDTPGACSYVMLISGENLMAFAEAAAATEQSATGKTSDAAKLWSQIPLAAEVRGHGTNPAGRCVAMADGHAEFLTSEEFTQACERFGIAVP